MVVLLPVLILTQLLWVFFDVLRLRSIDSEELLTAFVEHVAIRDSRPLPEFGTGRGQAGGDGPTIWALGASSIFFPEGLTFVEQLGQQLQQSNPRLRMLNLGISGIESRALVEQFETALAQQPKPPELLVIYAGHNDYNALYHASLARKFDLFESLFYLLAPFTRPGLRHGMTVYLRTRVPPLLEWFQRAGLVDLSHLDLEAVNQRVSARFRQNLVRIIERCRLLRVPVLLVTPVGNLLARPYGSLAATTAPYLLGMSLRGEARLGLLRTAQENEFVTYDIRAKAGAVAVLRSLAKPGIVVVDLDACLVAGKVRLDPRLFSDYFHFTKWGHARVAECLRDAVAAWPELTLGLGIGQDATARSH